VNEQARDIIARKLADHYGAPSTPIACACMGVTACCVGCACFWRSVLDMPADQVRRIFKAHFVSTGQVQI